jgi:hypothetical protein
MFDIAVDSRDGSQRSQCYRGLHVSKRMFTQDRLVLAVKQHSSCDVDKLNAGSSGIVLFWNWTCRSEIHVLHDNEDSRCALVGCDAV